MSVFVLFFVMKSYSFSSSLCVSKVKMFFFRFRSGSASFVTFLSNQTFCIFTLKLLKKKFPHLNLQLLCRM